MRSMDIEFKLWINVGREVPQRSICRTSFLPVFEDSRSLVAQVPTCIAGGLHRERWISTASTRKITTKENHKRRAIALPTCALRYQAAKTAGDEFWQKLTAAEKPPQIGLIIARKRLPPWKDRYEWSSSSDCHSSSRAGMSSSDTISAMAATDLDLYNTMTIDSTRVCRVCRD